MREPSGNLVSFPEESTKSVLDEILRHGARQMLTEAIEAEVASYIAERNEVVDGQGRRLIVRNGHLPERAAETRRCGAGEAATCP